MKYVFLTLAIQHGEFEFTSRSVHVTDQEVEKYADSVAKEFYFTPSTKVDDGYTFWLQDVFVRVEEAKEISKEHYETLKHYL